MVILCFEAKLKNYTTAHKNQPIEERASKILTCIFPQNHIQVYQPAAVFAKFELWHEEESEKKYYKKPF